MDIIYQEKISGATMDRKELQRLLEELQPGDTIFVTDLTRITRSTKDLFSLIGQIRDKNAYLKSLKDTWLGFPKKVHIGLASFFSRKTIIWSFILDKPRKMLFLLKIEVIWNN